ncbi:Ras GTPase [Pelomyxa schiedti]|nr:Ras GTPase [Pelomyxa schiedti]
MGDSETTEENNISVGGATSDDCGSDEPLHHDAYKVIVMGDGGVGKSAITIALTQKQFITEYDPTIENAYTFSLTVEERICMLSILDTAGQEEFSAMREAYFRQGHGFLLVWSVADRASFDVAQQLYTKILRVKESDTFPTVMCANKVDVGPGDRVVTRIEGEEFAKKSNAPYFETSAKTNQNIEASFEALVRYIRVFTNQAPAAPVEARPAPTPKPHKRKPRGLCILL